jgi:predicted Zn-dependent peptidase
MSIKHDINRRMRDAAFPNTFFTRSLSSLGSKGSIARITQSDVQEFYDTHYTPANMSVVVVGELTLAQAVKVLGRSPFGDYKPGVRTPFPVTIPNPPLPTETECQIHEGAHYVGTQSASFMSIAQLSGAFIPAQIWIVHEMIQAQLFKTIRLEQAWTYHIGCDDFFFGDFYEFSVKCSSLDVQAMGQISRAVDSCIESVRLRSDLFDEAKHKLVVSKHFSDSDMSGISEAAKNDLLSLNRIVALTEELQEAESVQLSDIYPVLDGLASNRRWTMIGYP